MKDSNNGILYLLSFIALIIIGVLIFVNQLLPLVGINITGAFFNLLNTVERLLTLIVIGFSAYYFVANKKKFAKFIYWIALIIFVVGIVLIWL